MNDTNDTNERGQVGIGTLIIFIALVLVAAVAAGVLVNTAGLLQAKAQDTGADAQSQVSNQIDVIAATGAVNGNTVDQVTLVVKKSPGSDPINVSEAAIEYTSSSDAKTLTNADYGITYTNGTAVSAGHQDLVLDDTGDKLKIVLTLDGTGNNPSALTEGSSATLRIVDQSGATTVYGVNVPDVLSGDYVTV